VRNAVTAPSNTTPDRAPVPLAQLIERVVRGTERGSKHWTVARRKDSLARVLGANRSDERRLLERLTQLVASWDDDTGASTIELASAAVTAEVSGDAVASVRHPTRSDSEAPGWAPIVDDLADTVSQALPAREPRAESLNSDLAAWRGELALTGPTALTAGRISAWSGRARRLLAHRHHLFDQLGKLSEELALGLTELSEDDSWARGQSELIRRRLADGLSSRAVRSVSHLLAGARERQRSLREERAAARAALKSALQRMLSEVGELGSSTGRFEDELGRYADVIERADSIESLAGAVREMVERSHHVRVAVQETHRRLATDHARASELAARVRTLEDELRRLSDEVSTDPLTGIANRRGMLSAYEAESARMARDGAPLAVGLIDIDDFKRLNDRLGHAAGDQALVALAARVSESLRPMDHVARFGGEEFVVLLPKTSVDEAQQTLTRLQRALSTSLFLHNDEPVLVTFSAGVTQARAGETIELALERADEALYQAKRTGKNRTCVA